MGKGRRSTDKRYPGDNRLMVPKSPYRRHRLAPRCRLVSSWGWSRSQGSGCSPVKEARELGLERRSLRLRGVIRGCTPAHIGGTRVSDPNATLGQYRGKVGTWSRSKRPTLRDSWTGTEVSTSNSCGKPAIGMGSTSARAFRSPRAPQPEMGLHV